MGRVEALCISEKKGEQKTPVDRATFVAGHGIESDGHAGDWHRQVSLLAAEDVETVREKLPDVSPGAFAENVIISGIDFTSLGLGSIVRLGPDVVLSVSQLGKACHTPCRIHYLTGDCIMPRLGLFAKVDTGGEVNTGDIAEVVEAVPRERFQAVVLTISDRCAAGEAEDTAGPAVAEILREKLGAHIYKTAIIPDEKSLIEEKLRHYSDGHSIDLVVTAGGTGFAPRDVTPEATRLVVERLTPGLDEAMRAASMKKTPHAMLSRAVTGIRESTLIINLPGSLRAATENLESILGPLRHGLNLLRGKGGDCGRPAAGKNTDG